jgi:hypothetical protein
MTTAFSTPLGIIVSSHGYAGLHHLWYRVQSVSLHTHKTVGTKAIWLSLGWAGHGIYWNPSGYCCMGNCSMLLGQDVVELSSCSSCGCKSWLNHL